MLSRQTRGLEQTLLQRSVAAIENKLLKQTLKRKYSFKALNLHSDGRRNKENKKIKKKVIKKTRNDSFIVKNYHYHINANLLSWKFLPGHETDVKEECEEMPSSVQFILSRIYILFVIYIERDAKRDSETQGERWEIDSLAKPKRLVLSDDDDSHTRSFLGRR